MKIKILIAILIAGLIIITFFIPVKEERMVRIGAPALAISQQLNNAANWKKWNTSLKKDLAQDSGNYTVTNDYKRHIFSITTSQQSYLVKAPAGNSFEISKNGQGAKVDYHVLINFNKDSNSTLLLINKNSSLFESIFSFGKDNNASINLFNDLKDFMETDSLYYGFPIEIRKVVDSNVVFLKRHIIDKEKFAAPITMFKELKEFITANQLIITQPLILQYSELPGDSLNIMAMIAINKKITTEKKIRFTKMPVDGRMLVGQFKGKFKDRIQLQLAMQRYILDKNLYNIVGSYDKYTNNKLPENEESIVEIEMYFPIL